MTGFVLLLLLLSSYLALVLWDSIAAEAKQQQL